MHRTMLKQVFGYGEYRPGQEEIISAILSGCDVLGIMPTGAGKSVCYQVPALMTDGIALVISPLVSLMKDQVAHLVKNGVRAAYINSSLTPGQMRTVMQRARDGAYKIIYVAPERLLSPDFIDFASRAALSMVTVDEAHCVSQWGHDFRTSYLQIASFIGALPRRPVLTAFTATATAQVREDILGLLGLRDPFIKVTGFDRENLYFSVKRSKSKMDDLLAFLADKREDSLIVYCATRQNVETVCETLQLMGFSATRYHAGLSKAERDGNQEDFVFERSRIMVATNAFGMGIDKSNVRSVVHYNMPKNLESYYQEAGRAGRDGENASCLLLYSPQDVHTAKYMILHGDEDSEGDGRNRLIENNLELLKQMTFYATTQDCLRRFILGYFGEAPPLSCGCCGNCDANFIETDITEEARKIISCVVHLQRRGRPLGKSMTAAVLRGSENQRIRQLGLASLPTYGIMKEASLGRIQTLIENLLERRYLEQTGGEYPVLAASERSAGVIRGTEPVIIKLVQEKKPEKADKPEPGKKSKKEKPASADPGLFEHLRRLRFEIASEESVPAYIVFTDATLRGMCAARPQSMDEMSGVSGVGQAKLAKYGERFLEAIREYDT